MQTITVEELLKYETGSLDKLLKLSMGYTEVPGDPELRGEIAKLYTTIDTNHIIVHAGAEEAIFNILRSMVQSGDHMVSMFPAYQSSYDVPKSVGCEVTPWKLKVKDKKWTIDLQELKDAIRPNTKLIYINSPNNPTGFTLSEEEINEIVKIAKEHDIFILSDEVYYGLEFDGHRRPAIVDLYDKGISINVMSKTYGMAGLRIGWTVCKDQWVNEIITRAKHYTTVCNSCASEFLATVALRNSKEIVERNSKIVKKNYQIALDFFAKYNDTFEYIPPQGGTIAFVKMNIDKNIDDFCTELVREKGVVLLSSKLFDTEGQYFRLGIGRENFSECLDQFENYLIERKYV